MKRRLIIVLAVTFAFISLFTIVSCSNNHQSSSSKNSLNNSSNSSSSNSSQVNSDSSKDTTKDPLADISGETTGEATTQMVGQTLMVKRPITTPKTYDFTSSRFFPKSEKPTSKEIQWINMMDRPFDELMMMETLQGNVNRVTPSMYIVNGQVVEGPRNISVGKTWLDQMDSIYKDASGKPTYTKREVKDPYQMIIENKDKIKGFILYHPRLVDGAMASGKQNVALYADTAVLDLTLMMCGVNDAVALTQTQYTTLRDKYGLNLKMLGDTTQFMEKNSDGSISKNRGSRVVWQRVYDYALAVLAPKLSKDISAHNSGFQAPSFDIMVATRCFVFNRILDSDATQREKDTEIAFLQVTKVNTPMIGIWYLDAGDEHPLATKATVNGKIFMVTYETYNLSWSYGLPVESIPVTDNNSENDIKLDKSKIYISFSNTEGDNSSYHFMSGMDRLNDPVRLQEPNKYPMGWNMAPALFEAAPYIIKNYANNWQKADSIVSPEGGIDYLIESPPKQTRDEYFAMTDYYMSLTKSNTMRWLYNDVVVPLPYAEGMKKLQGVFAGYVGMGFDKYNKPQDSAFLYRNTVFFKTYDGTALEDLAKVDAGEPGFYAITLAGFSQGVSSIKNLMSKYDDRFVVVSPDQLVKLYKEYYGSEFKNITEASFKSGLTREEMGFLFYASDHTTVDSIEGSRYADGKNYFVYKLDVDKTASKGKLNMVLSGDYQVEVSNDYLNWEVVGQGEYGKEKANLAVDISKYVAQHKPVYVRIGDRTPLDPNGGSIYSLDFTTEKSGRDNFIIDPKADAAYLTDINSTLSDDGRSGEFVYRLDIKQGVPAGDVVIASSGTVTVQISTNNKTFKAVTVTSIGNSRYIRLTGLSGPVYLKIKASDVVSAVKFLKDPEPVKELSFSPIGSIGDLEHSLSLDKSDEYSDNNNSKREVTGNNVLIYKLMTTSDVHDANLDLKISGLYKISISKDGINYQTVKEVQPGSMLSSKNYSVNINKFIDFGKVFYVRFELANADPDKMLELFSIRLITDKSSAGFLERLANEVEVSNKIAIGSKEELNLLSTTLGTDNSIYKDNGNDTRIVSNTNGTIVYKLDFSQANKASWNDMGLNVDEVSISKIRVDLDIGNDYMIEVSKDASNWTVVSDYAKLVQSSTNRKTEKIQFSRYFNDTDKIIYIRVRDSRTFPTGSHNAILYQLLFYY
jgi:hypothetical protein